MSNELSVSPYYRVLDQKMLISTYRS